MNVSRRSTYRVQLNATFGFDQAAEVADYLAALGVSHLYTSPYLQAAPGSTHGYDVIDHSRISDDLGGAAAHARMIAALRAAKLGHIVDTIPNHMSIAGRENRWWWDVLRNGLTSAYARFFDIDWEPPEARLRNTLLLPVLADQYGRALERGEIRLERDGSTFTVRYKDREFPVDPRSLAGMLRGAATASRSERLAFIADTLELLPPSTETDPQAVERRRRDDRMATEMLDDLLAKEPDVVAAIVRAVGACNGDPDSLDRLLDQQNYRLAWWQAADRDLGYRRFFDVNTLIALRVEDPHVFEATHQLVAAFVRTGVADGLRVDHVDGVQDPEVYLQRLREACPCYLVVEKILATGERVPDSWPVEGTTGYDFLNLVMGLFVEPAAEGPLTQFYANFASVSDAYADVAHDKRLLVLREGLGSDVNRLAELLLRICEQHRRHRDYTRHLLTEGLRALLASFPVYRTYVQPGRAIVREEDRRTIDVATSEAKRRRPDIDPELFDFLRAILTLGEGVRGELETTFVRRFQQLSTAVMAKGVEDTAFYTYNRFVALNEVGGDPSRFGIRVDEFHARMHEMQERRPQTMLATATHDTKRGEDVRARLCAITECPSAWTAAVERWSALNERHRSGAIPDRNTEYLYYQTLVGAWPLTTDRAVAYMQKATREAKTHTSWTSPQKDYDEGLQRFVERTLNDQEFTRAVREFVDTLITPGRVVSLAQTLIKLTAPGVPDLYQGTEVWSLSLVDPDNRRPVDFAARRRLLDEIQAASPEQVLARADEGAPKLWMIHHALRTQPAGCYEAIAATGTHAARVVAFARGGGHITVVPRLVRALQGNWGDTALELPHGEWRNVFTGETHRGSTSMGTLLARFPVALLERIL